MLKIYFLIYFSIIWLLLLFVIIIVLIKEEYIKIVTLVFSILLFIVTCILLFIFNTAIINSNMSTLTLTVYLPVLSVNITCSFGIDIFSVYLIFLTNLIFMLSIYYSIYTVHYNYRIYSLFLVVLWLILNLIFTILDLLVFYILFEMLLVPMFFLIMIWGNRTQSVRASIIFFMYTSIFSLIMLFALCFIYIWFGTFDFIIIKLIFSKYPHMISAFQLKFICISLALTFIVKLPIIPFHIWLPEAHVEAPTACSVILASILLKVGAYGLIRFVLPISSIPKIYLVAVITVLGFSSLFYSVFLAYCQVDLKKIIAYSSVAHMSFTLIGLASFSSYSIIGAWLMLIAHGFVSAALFFMVGMLYERFNTRLLKYYSGLHNVMPKLSFFMLFFMFANIGFPGSINFISELLIFIGVIPTSTFICIIVFCFSFILSLLYSIWIYNKIFFGTFDNTVLLVWSDLKQYEINILVTLMSFTIIFGFLPNIFIPNTLLLS